MRGGALPLLSLAGLLMVLLAINWVWTDDAIQIATFAFAVLVLVTFAAALWAASRLAIRPGPPEPRDQVQTIPSASAGAVLAGVAIATLAFGLAFGRAIVLIGAGLLIAALARMGQEYREERRTRDLMRHGSPP